MIWLLPGMDGTGLLFGPLRRHLAVDAATVRYQGGDYDTIERGLPSALLHPAPDDVLVAESFGGPLALRIAARHRVERVVLIATFVRAPRFLPPSRWIRLAHPPPRIGLRAAMLGLDAPRPLVDEVARVIASVPAETLAARIDALRALDAREALRATRSPIVWLHATHDRLVSRAATNDARAVHPDLEVHAIEGPHLLAQRFPERIAPFL